MKGRLFRKIWIPALVLFAAAWTAEAQSLDSLIIEARGSWLHQNSKGGYSSALQAEYFNIQLGGTISDNLSYRIRQRMNIPIDAKNPFRATDLLSLTWQVTPQWSITTGKTAILIGCYEYDSAPIDVYYYSQFCSNLSQCFAFGINSEYEISDGQSIVVQISNSPLSTGFENTYAYNAAWTGLIAPWWKTVWSCNFVEDNLHRYMNYIALGNHLVFGGLAIDFDLFHRASFRQDRYFFTDYSFISKAIWTVNRWNFCFKAGHEYNSSANIDEAGLSYDTVIPAGTQYFYGGCGIEYFPGRTDDVRLHLAYFRNSFDHTDNFTFGVKWKIDVLKRKD